MSEESSVAMGGAGLNTAPPMYYPQNTTPIDSTMVSPHFAMMATAVPGSQTPVVTAHSHGVHVSSAGSNAGGVDEAQALVASNVPFAAGPPHIPQFMHIQHPLFAAGINLHGQPMPGPGGNSGSAATAVNMFQTVPQVPLQQVSTPAPHLQAGVPAIAPRHMAPFGPHVPVSGHGIPVQFTAPVANILPHPPNVGANSGVPSSGVGIGSGVATLNNTSSPTFQSANKHYRARGLTFFNFLSLQTTIIFVQLFYT